MNIGSTAYSPVVREALSAAGWYEGRQVPELLAGWNRQIKHNHGVDCFPAAERVLVEFGGLRVGSKGPGVECSSSVLEFDPIYAADDYSGWERALGRRIYPLGSVDDGQALLIIDELGECYFEFEGLYRVGTSIADALEHTVRGLRSPMLDLEWQD